MERRGFLGSLLALPILTGFKKVEPKALENVQPNIDPNINKKLLGVIVRQDGSAEYIYEDDPVRYPQCIPGSGTIEKMNIVSQSGICPGLDFILVERN